MGKRFWGSGGACLSVLFLLVGCPDASPELIGGARPPAAPTAASGNSLGGSLGDPQGATPTTSPTLKPAATPKPVVPTPTPKPQATPRVGIKSVSVSNASIILYPPAQNADLSLGFTTWAKLEGQAVRTDDIPTGAIWIDRSGGQLLVGATGRIETKASTLPGTYFVRCQALDDPHVYQDVLVEVRPTSELQVIIR